MKPQKPVGAKEAASKAPKRKRSKKQKKVQGKRKIPQKTNPLKSKDVSRKNLFECTVLLIN